MKLLALGGCGGMGRFAVETALSDEIWTEVVIADRDEPRARTYAAELDDPRASACRVDVTDASALRALLEPADVVLTAVGPYFRFGVLVLEAAIDAGTSYVDLNDDWQPTLEMLALDGAARSAGVTAIVGMGASPGVSNLLAVRAARELDRVDVLHTIWGLGEKGLSDSAPDMEPGAGGSFGAAIEHWIEQLTGAIRVTRDGVLADDTPLRQVEVDYPGVGQVTCHTVGHPEPVTLQRSFPNLASALNLMDMPKGIIEMLRRIAADVGSGACTALEGASRIDDFLHGGARLLLSGPGRSLLMEAILGARHLPQLCAYAEGQRDGRLARVGASLTAAPPGGMGGITGVPAGLVLGLVARDEIRRRGVAPPEEVLDPDAFFRALAPHCDEPSPDGAQPVDVRIAAS